MQEKAANLYLDVLLKYYSNPQKYTIIWKISIKRSVTLLYKITNWSIRIF